uniref:Uncharacterized protein n=1 Tax=Dulem virus 38 TaxID=3145756 RepID=A0AAU8B0B4_9CAUD
MFPQDPHREVRRGPPTGDRRAGKAGPSGLRPRRCAEKHAQESARGTGRRRQAEALGAGD